MDQRARTAATAHFTSHHEVNIFRTALRHIGRGFVEIAQGIGLIAEGTLRPVRGLVPSLVALTSIVALTVVTLVVITTTVAQTARPSRDEKGTWTRWSSSPDIRFGDNTMRETDLDDLAPADAWTSQLSETAYVALMQSER